MELVKVIILAILATLCRSQMSGDGADVIVTVTRAYRDENSYQMVYDNLYNEPMTVSARFAHYNVSKTTL